MSNRFEWHSYYAKKIIDTKTNKIIGILDTLNEQDLKELDDGTKESLYASREYLDKLKSEKWGLERQLAEKDKENDELQDKLHSYYEEIMNKGTCGLCEYVRTDYKIEFAVEQLEKVKKLIEEKYTFDVEESDFAVVYETDIDEIFDNQIKQLKEGK